MISELHLENLKSFGGRHEPIQFRPLTLVYGPNSAGKSSLIQALALLKQTLAASARSQDVDPRPVFSGEHVDLGSFMTAIHGHDPARTLGVGLRFRDPTPGQNARDTPLADEQVYAGLRFRLRSDPTRAEGDDPRQEQAVLGDKDDLLAFRRMDDGRFEFAGSDGPTVFLNLLASRAQLHRDLRTPQAELDAANLQLVAASVQRYFESGARPRFLSTGLFPALPEPGFLEDDRKLDMMLGLWFEEYLYSRARTVTEILGSLSYLGPIRILPSRFQLLAGAIEADVGFTGEHTTALLWSNGHLLEDVNRWLTTFGQRYALTVLRLGVRGHAALSLNDASAIQIGDLVTTALVDRDSGIAVTPRDVGFGISQMLPIVVQVLVNRGATICVEQPEVHIHPRLQAELADLFIESTRSLDNQVIVETHSEALMLRVQRRVAEGRLRPEDVSVLYVTEPEVVTDQDGAATRTARALPLPLDETGTFTVPWPDGFFAEREDDVFARSSTLLKDFYPAPEGRSIFSLEEDE